MILRFSTCRLNFVGCAASEDPIIKTPLPKHYNSYLPNMFYRRKIILALLELSDGQLEKLRLQKLLFLLSQEQENAAYDFIPYRFGCYSYSAAADIKAMVKRGFLSESEHNYSKSDATSYVSQLKPDDRTQLENIARSFGSISTHELIKHTYVEFPFFAIKSEIVGKMLSKEERNVVEAAIPKRDGTILFTIGYEGISLEEYLVRLIKNDVKVLVDVRNNPMSMKFGFSKSQLVKYCSSLNILYVHVPEVGIQSDKRRALNTQADYDELFEDYCATNLPNTSEAQQHILQLLKKHKRIALTCFEANICQCHRKHLAEALQQDPSFHYQVKHI